MSFSHLSHIIHLSFFMVVFCEFFSSNCCCHRYHICFLVYHFFFSRSLILFTFDFLLKYATDGQYFAIIAYVMAFNRENYVNSSRIRLFPLQFLSVLSTSLSACHPFVRHVNCLYLEKLTVINCGDDVKSNVSIVCTVQMIDAIIRFIDFNEYH